MKLKEFFTKNWIHILAILVMFIMSASYFSLQFDGYGLKQHDIDMWRGQASEIIDYRERTGKEAQWTNSMFGGMPATQVSMVYEGNVFKEVLNHFFELYKTPGGIVFLYMLGFYIFGMCIRLNKWVALLGAIAFGFTTYDIIIIQAGHHTKAYAAAFLAPLLGALIMAFKYNRKWGIILSGVFMSLELAVNHLQVTYYFVFVMLAVGIVLLIEAIRDKSIKNFIITAGGILGIYLLSIAVNFGNIALTQKYAKHTMRGGNDLTITPDGRSNKHNVTEGLERDYVTQWSYGIGETFTLISPYVKGGGSVPLASSPFKEKAENMDIATNKLNGAMNYPMYWGEQPATSGPVYVGIVVFFLALLGMFFLKTPLKWAFFITALLTIMLSWGKNFMWLTDLFLDYVPGYNKFRAVTIILLVTGVVIPMLGAILLDYFVKERENLEQHKKKFFIISGAFVLFLLFINLFGLGDNYTSSSDKRQMEAFENQKKMVKEQIMAQVLSQDPVQLQEKFNLDINNEQQVEQFVDMQAAQYVPDLDLSVVKEIRESVFHSSMNRSILFAILAIGVISLLFVTKINSQVIVIALTVLVAIDLIAVSYNYLGNQYEDDNENSYRYWQDIAFALYPEAASAADEQILQMELQENPALQTKIQEGIQAAHKKADKLGFYEKKQIKRVEDLYRFQALSRNTNYRVFDVNGNFNSATASYFHKSLGGYHGAKLRSAQNLIEFHLSRSNNKVYDMMNVKYFIQSGKDGVTATKNPTAMGNAWLVREVQACETPDEEILSLGSKFHLKAKPVGTLIVNGDPVKEADIYGSEDIHYVIKSDTIDVPITNGLRKGMAAVLVMDMNGKTDYIPKQMLDNDTTKSFLQLVELEVLEEFEPAVKAVMLKSMTNKLTAQNYTGEGNIRMTSYEPNRLVYEAETQGKQLAVFSEVYYPDGWKAFVDGKEVPILKADYILRAIELPGGKHKIEFVFDQPEYHRANTITKISSVLFILVIVAGIGGSFWRKRKNKEKATI